MIKVMSKGGRYKFCHGGGGGGGVCVCGNGINQVLGGTKNHILGSVLRRTAVLGDVI